MRSLPVREPGTRLDVSPGTMVCCGRQSSGVAWCSAGVAAFVVADVVRLLILIAFPVISLWLPAVLRIAGKGY
jgi:hypothetical protein